MLKERQETLERALESAVSRALRDNLAPLQRSVDELHQAYADLVSACASARPTNALPPMLRAQTTAAALSAGLNVLSTFVTAALNSRENSAELETSGAGVSTVVELDDRQRARDSVSDNGHGVAVEEHPEAPEAAHEPPNASLAAALAAPAASDVDHAEHAAEPIVTVPPIAAAPLDHADVPVHPDPLAEPFSTHFDDAIAVAPAAHEQHPSGAPLEAVFDLADYIASLPADQQELHRRANRVAKVSMQDIKLLKPAEVQQGRDNKDICVRLRPDLDKARKEYDRRFRAIQDHPVDYFHRWMPEILAGGDSHALGEYPYPSPVLRH